jgi:hypothetical protein
MRRQGRQSCLDQLQGGHRTADSQVAGSELLPNLSQGIGELGAVAVTVPRIRRHGFAQYWEQELGNVRVVEVQGFIEGADDLWQAALHAVGAASWASSRQ